MRTGTFVAALVALFVFLIGSLVVAGLRGVDMGAVSDLLFRRASDATLLKTGLAWVWLALGVAGVASAFAAFVVLEDDRAPNRLPHRRFPKAAPVLLLAASLGVLWLLFAPARSAPAIAAATPPPAAQGSRPPPEDALDAALVGGAGDGDAMAAPAQAPPQAPPPADIVSPPAPPAESPPAPPAPLREIERAATTSEETPLFWTYEYPYVRDGRIVSSPEVDRDLARLLPMDDPDGSVARMLCGKAWLAFSGSASEEGPPERNAIRARARAELLARRAAAWLDAHPDCDRPVILALDLGQHVATGAGDPGQTAYQRQAIIVSRARTSPSERLTEAAAKTELEAFYAEAAMRARLLGARRFRSPPAVFAPGGG